MKTSTEKKCLDCAAEVCPCEKPPLSSENEWVIAENGAIITVKEFRDSMGPSGFLHSNLIPHFETREEAAEMAFIKKTKAIDEERRSLHTFEKQLQPDLPSTKEKLEMYEGLLHDIQMFSSVIMDGEKVEKLIRNINHWSYAHRCGNGEYSDEEQATIVAAAFKLLRKR